MKFKLSCCIVSLMLFSSCTMKLKYYVEEGRSSFTKSQLETILKENKYCLDHISKKLAINRSYSFDKLIFIPQGSRVPNNRGKKRDLAIFIDFSANAQAEFDQDSRIINIPDEDMCNPIVHTHEIAHHLTKVGEHLTKTNGEWTLGNAIFEHGCLNLMRKSLLSPFTFLITETQNEAFKKGEKQESFENTHKFPADLIGDQFEFMVTCCYGFGSISNSRIADILYPGTLQPDYNYIRWLRDQLENLINNNICPIQDEVEELVDAQNIVIDYSGITNPVPSDLDDLAVSNERVLAHIIRIAKMAYVSDPQILNLYRRESNYLTPEGGDSSIVLNNRLHGVYNQLYEHQVLLEKNLGIPSPSIDELRDLAQNSKILLPKFRPNKPSK